MDINEPLPCFQRAMEHYDTHRTHALDLNQPAQLREFHKAQAKRAEGDILELFDNQGD